MAKKKKVDLERKIMDTDSYWKSYLNLVITFSPTLVALALLVSAPLFWKEAPRGLLSLVFFIAGFSGVIIIVKREIPLVLYSAITGWQAVLEGVLISVICWALAIYGYLYGR
jgi:hypothetical protein